MRHGRILASLLGIGIALALGEGAGRVAVLRMNQKGLEALDPLTPPPKRGEPASLGQIVQGNADPSIIYELRPNLDGPLFMGARLRTDANGFRSAPPARDKSNDTIRILGLGDSVMFGWGVENDEGYLALLEKRLMETVPGRNWEVINTAVPGYNTVQEVEVLLKKGLALEPDLVLLGLVGNDWNLPNFIRIPDNPLDPTRSYLIEWLRTKMSPPNVRSSVAGLERTQTEFELESDPRKVPEECRHLVGGQHAFEALQRLLGLAKQHGFALIIYPYERNPGGSTRNPWYHSAMQIQAEYGVPALDLRPLVPEFLRGHGILSYEPEDFVISSTDPHPSALHHRLIAEGFYRLIEQGNLLRGLLNRDIHFRQ